MTAPTSLHTALRARNDLAPPMNTRQAPDHPTGAATASPARRGARSA